MKYFISYHFKNKRKSGIGNSIFKTENKITGENLQIIENEIAEAIGENHKKLKNCNVIILNFIEIPEEVQHES